MALKVKAKEKKMKFFKDGPEVYRYVMVPDLYSTDRPTTTVVTGRRMSLNLLAGVRPQSKVECLLGSGPKVKSRATVLWRQTRGAALWSKTEGLRESFA